MMTNKNKMIILGHSGFIGAHIEQKFSDSTDWDVIGKSLPDIDLTDELSANQLNDFLSPNSTLVLAAAVKRQFGDTLQSYQQNMAIIENVCSLIAKQPVKRVIFMSSTAVYGEETDNTNISENTHVNPTSYYGITKFTGERLLKKTCIENGVTSLMCLRPPLIYGVGDAGKTYGPSGFTDAACAEQDITLWGEGDELREFIYIDDFCDVLEHLINLNFSGDLNVVSQNKYCFYDVILEIKKYIPDLIVNSRARSKDKANNAFDASLIKSLLPPSFKFTSLSDGIAKMLSAE